MISEVRSYRHFSIEILIPVLLAITVGLFFIYISSNRQLGFVSGIVFILVGLYPFARGLTRKDFDVFEIINPFALYMLIGIGLRGLVGIKYGTNFWFYDPNSEHFDILRLKVFSYSTIALLALYLGYYSGLGNRWLNVLPRLNFEWCETRGIICLIIYFIISGVALILFTIKFGNWEGIDSFGKNPHAIQETVMEGGREHIASFICFFWVIYYVLCIYKFSKKKPLWAKIAFLFSVAYILVFFLHYGSKSAGLNALMVCIVIRHYLKKMVSKKMAVTIVAGIFVISLLFWHVRDHGIYQWNILIDSYISAFKNPVEFILPILNRSYEFDSFAIFIDAIDSGKSLEFGATMLELSYFFIPRVWWPEKPLSFGITFLSKYADTDSPGCMAPSLPGELYVNFHLIGIVLGFLLMGILMKLCYQGLIKRNRNNSSLLIYIHTFLSAPFIFEGGTAKLTNYLIRLFPIVLFLWIVKSKSKRV